MWAYMISTGKRKVFGPGAVDAPQSKPALSRGNGTYLLYSRADSIPLSPFAVVCIYIYSGCLVFVDCSRRLRPSTGSFSIVSCLPAPYLSRPQPPSGAIDSYGSGAVLRGRT